MLDRTQKRVGHEGKKKWGWEKGTKKWRNEEKRGEVSSTYMNGL